MPRAATLHVLKPDAEGPRTGRYGEFDGALVLDDVPRYLPKGSLVGIRPLPTAGWAATAEVIEATADRVVNAPLALWADLVGRRTSLQFAANAGLIGIRVVTHARSPAVEELRAALTDPVGWTKLVVAWISRRHGGLATDVAMLLEPMVAQAPRHSTVQAMADRLGPAPWKWSRVFSAAGLGPVGSWHRVLRAMGIALEVQRNPTTRVAVVAHHYGYSGSSALSDRLAVAIGARPTYIRAHLGWEWMLADALRRAQIMPGGRGRTPGK